MKIHNRPVFKKQYLVVAALFQVGIVVGMILLAMRPLWDGKEVLLEVSGRDPRSLFRGDYVALQYEFSSINLDTIPNDVPPNAKYTFGDELYVELQPQGRFYKPVGVWCRPPEGKLYVQAIVQYRYYSRSIVKKYILGGNIVKLSCGIEEYYTNPESAKDIDKLLLRSDSVRTVASVMVSANGEARIKKLHHEALSK